MRGFLLVSAIAALVIGCARREAGDQTAGDSVAVSPAPSMGREPLGARVAPDDAVVAAMRKRLDAWKERWKQVMPAFALDSLYREPPRPFSINHRRATIPEDMVRARLFGEVSPDSTRIVEPDTYRLRVDGVWELWGEPDAAPALIDLRTDSLTVLTVIGTVGGFEDAFWIDSNRFVLVGYGERSFEPWVGGGSLWVYDLAQGTLSMFHTPDVAEAAFRRYLARSRADQRKRFGVPADTLGSSYPS